MPTCLPPYLLSITLFLIVSAKNHKLQFFSQGFYKLCRCDTLCSYTLKLGEEKLKNPHKKAQEEPHRRDPFSYRIDVPWALMVFEPAITHHRSHIFNNHFGLMLHPSWKYQTLIYYNDVLCDLQQIKTCVHLENTINHWELPTAVKTWRERSPMRRWYLHWFNYKPK